MIQSLKDFSDEVLVRLLAMCRGELSATMTRLISNCCEAGESGGDDL